MILGFIPTFIPRLTSKWLKRATMEWQDKNHIYIQQLEDGLRGRDLVKRYRAVNFIFNQLHSALTNEQSNYFTMNVRQYVSSLIVGSLYVVSAMGSLAFGTWMVIEGNISPGMLLTIYMAADRVTTPLISLVNIYNTMVGSEPLLKKVLDETPAHKEPQQPVYAENNNFLISLKDVSIGYNNKPILENLNINILSGDKILIEGPSGSGKSTLLKTIMNEMDPLFGSIEYGKDLKSDFSNSFAVVEQQPFVFHNNLKYNLSLGSDFSDEQLYYVLKSVGLDYLANKNSLNIELGLNVHQLSGGELKRLEVARAILYGKNILVVDEALSGLDYDNADKLNRLILNYPGTVINIEHRIDEKIRKRFNKTLKLDM